MYDSTCLETKLYRNRLGPFVDVERIKVYCK